jgi:hypothetical protein
MVVLGVRNGLRKTWRTTCLITRTSWDKTHQSNFAIFVDIIPDIVSEIITAGYTV